METVSNGILFCVFFQALWCIGMYLEALVLSQFPCFYVWIGSYIQDNPLYNMASIKSFKVSNDFLVVWLNNCSHIRNLDEQFYSLKTFSSIGWMAPQFLTSRRVLTGCCWSSSLSECQRKFAQSFMSFCLQDTALPLKDLNSLFLPASRPHWSVLVMLLFVHPLPFYRYWCCFILRSVIHSGKLYTKSPTCLHCVCHWVCMLWGCQVEC